MSGTAYRTEPIPPWPQWGEHHWQTFVCERHTLTLHSDPSCSRRRLAAYRRLAGARLRLHYSNKGSKVTEVGQVG